jgi:pimeloyl-ACP methyl ester carboxylesterase
VIAGFGQLLKDHTNIAILPGLTAALYAEQYDILMPYVEALSPAPDPLNPIGAYLSMRCTDSILAVTDGDYAAALQNVSPAIRESFARRHAQNVSQCQEWGARLPTAADRLPAEADTPVLIISGALDPYSSQEWLDSTLATLPNGQGYMLPYHMHYVIQHPCAAGLLTGFIEDPSAELDAGCMAEVPPPTFRTG